MKVLFYGAGKLGRTLAREARRAGLRVTLRAARRGAPRRIDHDLVVLCVRDPDLPAAALALAGALGRRSAVVHVAGALGPEVLSALRKRVAGVGQAHPMLSFASAAAPPSLAGAHVLVMGDRVAVLRASRLARALGMLPRRLTRLDRTRYHAAAGLVANGSAALAGAGARLLVAAGVPRRAVPLMLGPLLRSVAENVTRLGVPQALTGPVRRGDAVTIRRHLDAIAHATPELVALYTAVARAQLPQARVLGDAPARALREVERVLGGAQSRKLSRGAESTKPALPPPPFRRAAVRARRPARRGRASARGSG